MAPEQIQSVHFGSSTSLKQSMNVRTAFPTHEHSSGRAAVLPVRRKKFPAGCRAARSPPYIFHTTHPIFSFEEPNALCSYESSRPFSLLADTTISLCRFSTRGFRLGSISSRPDSIQCSQWELSQLHGWGLAGEPSISVGLEEHALENFTGEW